MAGITVALAQPCYRVVESETHVEVCAVITSGRVADDFTLSMHSLQVSLKTFGYPFPGVSAKGW